MADSRVYVAQAQSPGTTSTFDITVAAESSRSPTGAIVFVTGATALNTNTTHNLRGIGVTDFTNTYSQFQIGDESGLTSTTDSGQRQNDQANSHVAFLNDVGTAVEDVGFTVAAITGGIRLTPSQTASQYRVCAWLFFGTACRVVWDGDSQNVDTTYNLAHGFSNAPKFLFCTHMFWATQNANSVISTGFATYLDSVIKQYCVGQSMSQNGLAYCRQVTRHVYNNRIATNVHENFDGTEDTSMEITAIDTSNVTITQRTAQARGNALYFMAEFDDVDVFLDIVNSPNSAASTWTYSGAPFEPQAALGILSESTSAAAGGTTDWESGSGSEEGSPWGLCAFDREGGLITAGGFSEKIPASPGLSGSDPTNTGSRVSQALFLHDNDGTTLYNMDTPAFTSSGFQFDSADISTASATTHYWPMLFIENASVAVNTNILVPTGPLR